MAPPAVAGADRTDRRDVVDARAVAIAVIATVVNSKRRIRAGHGGTPGVDALFAAAGERLGPLGFGRQAPTVPRAERRRFEPAHAIDWKVRWNVERAESARGSCRLLCRIASCLRRSEPVRLQEAREVRSLPLCLKVSPPFIRFGSGLQNAGSLGEESVHIALKKDLIDESSERAHRRRQAPEDSRVEPGGSQQRARRNEQPYHWASRQREGCPR